MSGQAHVDGGNFTVSTTGGITLARGSLIDVSSGAAILATGKTKGGKGGKGGKGASGGRGDQGWDNRYATTTACIASSYGNY